MNVPPKDLDTVSLARWRRLDKERRRLDERTREHLKDGAYLARDLDLLSDEWKTFWEFVNHRRKVRQSGSKPSQ